MDVLGHDYEAVELEFIRVAIAEEGSDHELRSDCFLEDSMALVCDGGKGIGAGLKAHSL